MPDTYEPVATSESYAEIWATLPLTSAAPLTSQRFRLTASHERVTVYATSLNPDGWREQVLVSVAEPIAHSSAIAA